MGPQMTSSIRSLPAGDDLLYLMGYFGGIDFLHTPCKLADYVLDIEGLPEDATMLDLIRKIGKADLEAFEAYVSKRSTSSKLEDRVVKIDRLISKRLDLEKEARMTGNLLFRRGMLLNMGIMASPDDYTLSKITRSTKPYIPKPPPTLKLDAADFINHSQRPQSPTAVEFIKAFKHPPVVIKPPNENLNQVFPDLGVRGESFADTSIPPSTYLEEINPAYHTQDDLGEAFEGFYGFDIRHSVYKFR